MQIILLVLSQDSSFSSTIHKILLPSVPWYKDRLLNNITLGSLVFIVLLKSALQHFSHVNDLYLPTNTLAALANLAPQVVNLHPHASQRLVSLFCLLGRRYQKLEAQEAEARVLNNHQVLTDMQVLGDLLRIVLEIINSILFLNLPKNAEMVYSILHKQDAIQALKTHPRLAELVDNLQVVWDFFNSRLDVARSDNAGVEWNVQKVLELVQTFAIGWRADRMRAFPEMRFAYEEESNPEEFFVPYVWSVVVARRPVSWSLEHVTLFTPTLLPHEEEEPPTPHGGRQRSSHDDVLPL